jgi:Raf kinase inhibitor-like YbhB/YbcL family protein
MNNKTLAGSLRHVRSVVMAAAVATCLSGIAGADDDDHHLRLSSTTFKDGGTLPLVTIFDSPGANGLNSCTADGSAGGDESPQLSWSHVPAHTKSFVIVTYDVTASFTHWGMYNIPAGTRSLPLNAGASGSDFGTAVANDFGDLSYDGPCPPMTLQPFVHHYVFTLYALDTVLPQIPTFGDFSPGSEALYHALIDAARHDHILATATITGLFASVAGAQ